jgi:hypothetical protein
MVVAELNVLSAHFPGENEEKRVKNLATLFGVFTEIILSDLPNTSQSHIA